MTVRFAAEIVELRRENGFMEWTMCRDDGSSGESSPQKPRPCPRAGVA